MRPPKSALTVWTYLGRYRGPIAIGIAMLVATNALSLSIPHFQGEMVDALKGDHPARSVPGLVWLTVALAAGFAVTRVASRILIFNAARAAEFDLRSDLFGHLLRLEPAFYRKHPTGDTMSRLTNDVQTVRAMWGAGVLNLVNTPLFYLFALVMMLQVDPLLTLWAVLPYPTIVVVGRIFGRRIYTNSREVQARLGGMSNQLQEDLGGIHVIKTYGLEDLRRKSFLASSLRLLDANMGLARVRGQLVPVLGALSSFGTVIVLWVGGHGVIRHDISLGQFTAFLGYLGMMVWPTVALGWMLSLLQRGKASWSRIEDLLRQEPGIADGDGPALADVRGDVEIRDLHVEIDGRPILDGVSLRLAPGTVTAIVGRTGSGKSTLVDALCRLIEVPPGTVFLDGRDIRSLPLAALRGAIGYAPQEAFLFSTAIADNVAMGYGAGSALPRARAEELERAGAATSSMRVEAIAEGSGPDTRIRHAADAAGLGRDLAAMPDGFATVVGERGITLSGGQRQRVALARALASAPRVLLLDDSLSSVDAETERIILERLKDVMRDRTSVLISHRVAAVKGADQIAVVDAGRIVECGTHDQLLAKGGLYADLYASQLDPDELAARVHRAEELHLAEGAVGGGAR